MLVLVRSDLPPYVDLEFATDMTNSFRQGIFHTEDLQFPILEAGREVQSQCVEDIGNDFRRRSISEDILPHDEDRALRAGGRTFHRISHWYEFGRHHCGCWANERSTNQGHVPSDEGTTSTSHEAKV